MLYDDDARVAWNLTEQLRKMMGVIVVVCVSFGLTVSEAKTEIICLTHEGDAGGTHHIQRRGSQPDVPPNERVRIPGGTSTTTTPICPSRSTGTYATHGAASGSTPLNYTTDRAPPSSSIFECQEPRYSRQRCTAASRGARACAKTTRCNEPTTAF